MKVHAIEKQYLKDLKLYNKKLNNTDKNSSLSDDKICQLYRELYQEQMRLNKIRFIIRKNSHSRKKRK
jgi:hypothetical protein